MQMDWEVALWLVVGWDGTRLVYFMRLESTEWLFAGRWADSSQIWGLQATCDLGFGVYHEESSCMLSVATNRASYL